MKLTPFPGARSPLIFGHRGCPEAAPENTRAAFSRCAAAGVPGIELDVHMCASGELVVIHDHSLSRTAGVEGLVEHFSYSELSELDIGSWFSDEFAGETLMTLDEVFEEFGDSFYFDIELKELERLDNGFALKVAECIQKYHMESKVIVSSFNPFIIRTFRRLATNIPTAHIYSGHVDVPPLLRRGFGFFVTRPDVVKPHHERISDFTVALFTKVLGRPLITWSVNSLEQGEQLTRMGVKGLISNRPLELLPLLSS
jgi:glycerophosphoryl diester phosphodiesterase